MLAANLELQQLEAVIERGLQGFVEAGKALTAIRDGKLYRQEHDTFEDYCNNRWKLGRSRAYQLMSASEVVQSLATSTNVDKLPQTEAQARPLTELPTEQQPQAWSAAQALSEKPTLEQVKRSVRAVKSGVPELEPGQQVTVQAPNSPFFGQSVEVIGIDGVIVKARTESGMEPFLANELTPQKPKVETIWAAQPTKADRMEGLEAALQVEQIRVQVLEAMLRRLIVAAQSQSLTRSLLNEAETLLG